MDNKVEIIKSENTGNVTYLFKCPHCEEYIEVLSSETNCRIFRHGTFKHNMEQVNPHLPKDQCDSLIQQDLVYGCCKPFRLVISSAEDLTVEMCDYI